jgi:integrase
MFVRIKGINTVHAKGRTYYYDRATGRRIKAQPGTEAFLDELRAIRDNGARSETRHIRGVGSPPLLPRVGTLGALITAYRASPEFSALAPRTRSDYGKVFDWLMPLDSMPLTQMDAPAVLRIRDRAFETRKRRFANRVRDVLRLLFSWGVPRGFLPFNPARGIKSLGRATPRRPWTDKECAIVLAEAAGGLRTAIALGMFAALRIDMARRITWSAISPDGTTITWRQKNDLENVLPIASELRAVLAETPRVATTIVTSTFGRSYGPGLSKAFRALIARLESEGRVGIGLTFHGLRHTAGARLGDLGVDPRTIAAMLGDKTLAMAIHYSEGTDRRQRASAAVASLEKARKRK